MRELSAIAFAGTNLGALMPSEMAPLLTGWAGSTRMGITITIASAESYSLDVPTMIGLIMDESSADVGRQYFLKQPYRDGLNFVADSRDNRVWLQVITEVLYLRSADILVRIEGERAEGDQATAAEVAAVAGAAQTGQESQQAQPAAQAAVPQQQAEQAADAQAATEGEASPSGVQKLAASKLDPIYGAYVRADSINDIFRKSDAYDYSGGFTRFVSVTDESMSLRRTWEPGLAIGVRGLTLEVDAETGEVLRAGPMGMTLRQMGQASPTP